MFGLCDRRPHQELGLAPGIWVRFRAPAPTLIIYPPGLVRSSTWRQLFDCAQPPGQFDFLYGKIKKSTRNHTAYMTRVGSLRYPHPHTFYPPSMPESSPACSCGSPKSGGWWSPCPRGGGVGVLRPVNPSQCSKLLLQHDDATPHTWGAVREGPLPCSLGRLPLT